MEQLRELLSGPARAGAGPGASPRVAGAPARPFAAELFEEGARAGPAQHALARQVAALDRAPATGMGDHLELDLDRRQPGRSDAVPESDLSLADLLDVINPLQHIPIVANVYRNLTGDTISGPARVAGAALYGGPLGMLTGIVNAIATQINGADPGDVIIAGLLGEDPPDDTGVSQAANSAPETALAGAARDPAAPPLATSFAPQPQAGPETGILTGNAALSALLGDLNRQGTTPAKATPIDVRAEQAPAAPRAEARTLGGAIPAHAFTRQMMQGLDKYREMAVERGGAGRPALEQLDRRL